MLRFRYFHKGCSYKAFAFRFTSGGAVHYRIILKNQQAIVIFPSAENPNLWEQSIKPGRTIFDHNFVQALAEGLYEARITER
jgi:hypothetical protein